jgi:transcription elongation GreA/GreB family factor
MILSGMLDYLSDLRWKRAGSRSSDVLFVNEAGRLELEAEVACLRQLRAQVAEEQRGGRRRRRLSPAHHAALAAELQAMDRQIRQLERAIESAEVLPAGDPRVAVGSRVVLVDHEGDRLTLRIVGPMAANNESGLLYYGSSLGRALIGKRVGDLVEACILDDLWQGRILEVGSIAEVAGG